MKSSIVESPNTLNVLQFWGNKGSLKQLKDWLDDRIKEGFTDLDCDIEWSYYNDLGSVNLVASKDKKV